MKHLSYFFVLLFSLVSVSAFSQKYHENDKEGLRNLLRQSLVYDEGSTLTNFEDFGLEVSDSLAWDMSEDWVVKIKNVTWNDEVPKRLIKFSHKLCISEATESVDFNCFSELTELSINRTLAKKYFIGPKVKISSLSKLERLSVIEFTPDNNNFETFPNLEYLLLNNTRIGNISLMQNSKLKHLDCSQINEISELDLSGNTELETVDCKGNFKIRSLNTKGLVNLKYLDVSSQSNRDGSAWVLDLTDNINLEYLNCYGSRISGLKISDCAKLEFLVCGYNLIRDVIDVTNFPNLVTFDCSNNSIGKLDLTKNPKLKKLTASYCNLTELDLSNNPNIERLDVSTNNIATLILPEEHKIDTIYLNSNWFRLSALPIPRFSHYTFNNQLPISGGTVDVGDEIDLSPEYNLDGNISSYEWVVDGWKPVEIISKGGGKFVLPRGYSGERFSCYITNPTFPSEMMVYNVTAGKELDLPTGVEAESQSKAMYVESQSVRTGEDIRLINPSTCAGVAGLYRANGQFVSKAMLSETTSLSVSQKGVYILNVMTNKGYKQTFKIIAY